MMGLELFHYFWYTDDIGNLKYVLNTDALWKRTKWNYGITHKTFNNLPADMTWKYTSLVHMDARAGYKLQ